MIDLRIYRGHPEAEAELLMEAQVEVLPRVKEYLTCSFGGGRKGIYRVHSVMHMLGPVEKDSGVRTCIEYALYVAAVS